MRLERQEMLNSVLPLVFELAKPQAVYLTFRSPDTIMGALLSNRDGILDRWEESTH